ncbi:glycosyltransferase family 4 protein, partial [Aurantimonas marianensis]
LYVAPPRNEGFGLTPLEAMASGAAVVASDAGAFADMIIEGETGRIVPVGDEKALAAAVEAYLADPDALARAGASALAHVRAKFPLAREAAEIQRVYERLWSAADRG